MCLKSGFHERNSMEKFWILCNVEFRIYKKSVLMPKKNNFKFKKVEILLFRNKYELPTSRAKLFHGIPTVESTF